MNRENNLKRDIIKHINVTKISPVRSAVGRYFPKTREAATEITAQTAFQACIWMLSRATGRLIAAVLWGRLPYGCEKTESGQLFIGAGCAGS